MPPLVLPVLEPLPRLPELDEPLPLGPTPLEEPLVPPAPELDDPWRSRHCWRSVPVRPVHWLELPPLALDDVSPVELPPDVLPDVRPDVPPAPELPMELPPALPPLALPI